MNIYKKTQCGGIVFIASYLATMYIPFFTHEWHIEEQASTQPIMNYHTNISSPSAIGTIPYTDIYKMQ